MPPADQSLTREHHLYITTAEFVFLHKTHVIVSVRDPITLKNAKKHGLTPLILYGLTVAGLPIRWMSFSLLSKPISVSSFLHNAWTNAKGLRGQPDILKISRHLAAACPGLMASMASIGVELKIAETAEKSLPDSMRAAQGAAMWITGREKDNSTAISDPIQKLNNDAKADHELEFSRSYRQTDIQKWLSITPKPVLITPNTKLEWKPGPWLSFWETNVPPDRPRYFYTNPQDRNIFLLLGNAEHDNDDIDVCLKDDLP